MRNLNTNWPPKNSCKVPFLFLEELRRESMDIVAKANDKNYTREEDKGMDI